MATRETRTAPSTKQTAFVANGSAMPVANRNAPIGGATSWFVSRKAPCIRELARPRSSRATRPGRNVLLAESAKVSAVPRMNSVTRMTAMLTVPLTIVATRTTSTSGATEVDDDDHPPSVEAVGGGASKDAEDQGREVLAEDRQRDEERIARLGRDEERPGGEHDAIADVVDERGGQEPAKAAAEPRGDDGLDRPGEQGAHRPQDTLPVMSIEHDYVEDRIAAHFGAIGKDEVLAAEIYADDAVLEYVQSGERIRGKADIIASRQAYPGRPASFEVHRSGGSPELQVVELTLRFEGDEPHPVVAVLEFRDAMCILERIYIAEPWDPPAYRARWVESISEPQP